jgi:hypothetical protein
VERVSAAIVAEFLICSSSHGFAAKDATCRMGVFLKIHDLCFLVKASKQIKISQISKCFYKLNI